MLKKSFIFTFLLILLSQFFTFCYADEPEQEFFSIYDYEQDFFVPSFPVLDSSEFPESQHCYLITWTTTNELSNLSWFMSALVFCDFDLTINTNNLGNSWFKTNNNNDSISNTAIISYYDLQYQYSNSNISVVFNDSVQARTLFSSSKLNRAEKVDSEQANFRNMKLFEIQDSSIFCNSNNILNGLVISNSEPEPEEPEEPEEPVNSVDYSNILNKISSQLEAVISFFTVLFILIFLVLFIRFFGWFFPLN